jgi:NADH dehydrogenase
MGRIAGHNVVCDLFGLPMIPFRVDWYVTVVDLGSWGAIYTKGFDHRLLVSGPEAKAIKATINRQRIYPPRSHRSADILAAAAPTIDSPPWQAAGEANAHPAPA